VALDSAHSMVRHTLATGGAQASLLVNTSRRKRKQQLQLRISQLSAQLQLVDENAALKRRLDALAIENQALRRRNKLDVSRERNQIKEIGREFESNSKDTSRTTEQR
jgi:hypothetical protein